RRSGGADAAAPFGAGGRALLGAVFTGGILGARGVARRVGRTAPRIRIAGANRIAGRVVRGSRVPVRGRRLPAVVDDVGRCRGAGAAPARRAIVIAVTGDLLGLADQRLPSLAGLAIGLIVCAG